MRERRQAGAYPGRTAACLLAAGLAVAACSRSGGPAPVEYGQGGETRRSAAPSGTASAQTARRGTEAGEPGVHTVRKGQTVYGIARRYGVSIRAVIDANDLTPPYDLRIGQELRIPVPERYVVQRGDTLYSISRRFGVDMNALARRNDIGRPYLIHPGDVLTVPDGDATRVAETRQREREQARREADREAQAQAEAEPETETADRQSPGSSGQRDAAATRADSAPSVAVPTPGEKPRALARRERQQRRDDGGNEAETRRASADADRSATPVSDPPARAAGSFLWPVEGEVIATYGPQDDGLHNDGVNIAAPSGTAIRAAANGVVAYVGDDLQGFGKLVLVKHADGWITAYAHAAAIIVERGDRVERGEPLARVGNSGNVSRPQLHFEVRKGSQAIDPQEVMATTRAARAGTSAG